MDAPPLAVSMGDPAGVGPEIIAKAWAARQERSLPPFVAVGDIRAIAAVWDGPTRAVSDLAAVGPVFDEALPVLTIDDAGDIVPGSPDVEGARCALHSLEMATGLVRSGAARALVTGPVAKANLYAIGFTHPGQTEFVVTVPRADARMHPTGDWDALGMRGTCSTGFSFEASGIADQILPAPFADVAADTMVPVSHLLWGAAWTGIAVEALSRARQFLRAQARRQPGVVLPGASRLMHATGLLELMQARLRVLIDQYDACHTLGGDRMVVTADAAGWPAGMGRAAALNTLKRDVSEMCHRVVLEAMLICGMAGYKNGTDYSVGRHLRDILSAQLMIANDRIAATTGSLLLAQRTDLGSL